MFRGAVRNFALFRPSHNGMHTREVDWQDVVATRRVKRRIFCAGKEAAVNRTYRDLMLRRSKLTSRSARRSSERANLWSQTLLTSATLGLQSGKGFRCVWMMNCTTTATGRNGLAASAEPPPSGQICRARHPAERLRREPELPSWSPHHRVPLHGSQTHIL